VSVSFKRLPRVVKPGDRVFLNDGLVQLKVDASRPTTCGATSSWAES